MTKQEIMTGAHQIAKERHSEKLDFSYSESLSFGLQRMWAIFRAEKANKVKKCTATVKSNPKSFRLNITPEQYKSDYEEFTKPKYI